MRILLLLVCIIIFATAASTNSYEIAKRIVASLPLEQKIGQMLQIDASQILKRTPSTEIDNEALEKMVQHYYVSSIFNNNLNVSQWIQFITAVQRVATTSGSKIPILYGLDSVHGANYVIGATMFPHFIGAAATFNPALITQQGRITAKDMRSVGIPWNFSPTLEVAGTPLWSRTYEIFGEDAYLNGVLGEAILKGYYGEDGDLRNTSHVAACMKHFVGYSYPHSGHDHTNTQVSERYLQQNLLPSFQQAVKAGVQTVMASMGSINNMPVSGSKKYLKGLLKQLKFDGVVVSDYLAIQQLVDMYHVAKDYKQAIQMSLDAGIDMAMYVTPEYFDLLLELVKEGAVSEARIDYSATKIVKLKVDLGLFENAIPDPHDPMVATIGSKQDKQVAIDMARESITLLKNEHNVLPLYTNQKILLTGATAANISALSGGWSIHWQGANDNEFPYGTNVLQGIKQYNSNVKYIKGCNVETRDESSLQQAIDYAKQVDVIVIVAGELPYAEVDGNINDLSLSLPQQELIQAMSNTGKPVVLVLVQGRPRIISNVAAGVSSILNTFLPGPDGGVAIADILFGAVNPSGKLPLSYPNGVNNLVPYWHQVPAMNAAMYEFGFGLSYTTFIYSNLRITPTSSSNWSEPITVTVQVTNTGSRTGKETILLFVGDDIASIAPAQKRLKRFTKVQLDAQQTTAVQFQLVPQLDLAFVGEEDTWIVEPGTFTFGVGSTRATFTLQ